MPASTRLIAFACGVMLWGASCTPDAKPPAPKPAPAPVPVAEPAVKPRPPKPVSAMDLPPRMQQKGDGISVTEYVDGRVNLTSTLEWNEAFNTTFDNCVYFRHALPVLKRQLSAERFKVLEGMCVPTPEQAKAEAKLAKEEAKVTKAAQLAAKAAERKAGVAKKP